jgi:hypothetical protein
MEQESASATERSQLLGSRSPSRVGTPVYVNVYDMAPDINKKTYWLGLGIFHSGVEIVGQGVLIHSFSVSSVWGFHIHFSAPEFAFGGHAYDFTGVITVLPKRSPQVQFRFGFSARAVS